MNRPHRQTVRLAGLVCRQLTRLRRRRLDELRRIAEEGAHLLGPWQRLARRMGHARRRGWDAASLRLADQMRRQGADTAAALQTLMHRLSATRLPQTPNTRQVIDELTQIEQEFGEYLYDPPQNTLSVVTEPIRLEGVMLGPFRVALHLDRLTEGRAEYDVIALDPHPATGNDHITHPHVSDERLCEGDAGPAIRSALEAGRLGDFFLLVNSVLSTYNPASPYVALDEWHGEPCTDCGRRVHEDASILCSDCEQHYCDECTDRCRGCEQIQCMGCLKTCPGCRDGVCDHCRLLCQACEQLICTACAEDALCPTCFQTRQDEHHEDKPQDQPQQQPPESGSRVEARPATHPFGQTG